LYKRQQSEPVSCFICNAATDVRAVWSVFIPEGSDIHSSNGFVCLKQVVLTANYFQIVIRKFIVI
jgi:hypothetical protein